MAGCVGETDRATLEILTKDFDFSESDHAWIPGFADYPAEPGDSARFELKAAYTEYFSGTLLTKRSMMLSGKNLNRDLFMFLKRKISGLQPDTDYIVTFHVELTSNLPAGSTATGSVYLKAGASGFEPKAVVESGYHVMNIDKGQREYSGHDMISLGDIRASGSAESYALITRNNTMANSRYIARSNHNGELWLIIGTDSTLEATTSIYYSRISIVLSASDGL